MQKESFSLSPKILTHPNIPKPLHGTNPRTILGENWWNVERQKAYAKYNYHCVACGVHKSKAKKHQWLEGHENYDIDYIKATMTIHSVEPLCHYCHNFIHSGRLKMIENKEKDTKEVVEILEHGFKILSNNNLKCFWGTFEYGIELKCNMFNVVCDDKFIKVPKNYTEPQWNDWRMVIDGVSYKGKFSSIDEWKNYYNINS